MRMIDSPSQSEDPFTFINMPPQQMRKDVLAGLALARRTLENAKQDLALGAKIDPSCIEELERTVAEYQELFAKLDAQRRPRH